MIDRGKMKYSLFRKETSAGTTLCTAYPNMSLFGSEPGPWATAMTSRQNQLPASLLASYPCKLNTFRRMVKNVVTSKGIEVGVECK
jgi:arginine decarboxylase-like protein